MKAGAWSGRRMSALVATVAMTLLAACSLPQPAGAPASMTVPGEPQDVGLAHPRIAVPDPGRSRYDRGEWQPHGWSDADGNGCNTREEVLLAEAVGPVTRGPGCKIVSGEWEDRYTGRRTTSPAAFQVDHLVALSDAYLDWYEASPRSPNPHD